MFEILKSICELKDWVFVYARRDFQNLFDEVELKMIPHIFCDPIQVDERFNEYGVRDKTIYTGSFIICVSSDFDEESYMYRYDNYIKPLIEKVNTELKGLIRCNRLSPTFKAWKMVEGINLFDYNFDGLIVTFNIEVDD